jgi:alkaline phosphatase D
VVLGGDVHAHYVARLLADFDDPGSAIVASEFCGTSISSLSLPQPRIDAALAFNPHILHGNGTQRGSVRFTVDAKTLQAELRAVDDARDAGSAVRTAARYVVEAGRPGPVAA